MSYRPKSHPSRVRGLKCFCDNVNYGCAESHPSRVRGLKLKKKKKISKIS